jgi:tetratricopeptide (TPR) repeat protein
VVHWKNRLALLVLAAMAMAACVRDPELEKQDYLTRGDKYAAEKRFAEATLEYSKALELDPNYGAAEVALASAYQELGDYGKAAGSLARAADLLPDDLDLQLRSGSMRLLARSYEDAKGAADRVLAKQPSNVVAQLLRANALAGLTDIDNAVKQIEQAIALDPGRAELYTNLGSIHSAGHNRDEAEAAFKRAVALAPNEPRVYASMASFYWQDRRLAEAEQAFLKAVELDRGYVPGHRILASFYLSTGRPQKAEPFLKAVADATTDIDSDVRLADFYMLNGKRDLGLKLFQQLATEPAGFGPATTRLAAHAYAQGNREEGHRLLNDLLSKQPQNPPALQLLGHFYFLENKLDDAFAKAQAAVQHNPRLDSGHYLLARIHLARGNVQDAILELKEVVQLNDLAAPAQMLLAQLQSDAGYPDLAVTLAASAVKNAGGSPDMRLAFVRVLFAKGDLARAQTELDGLRKVFPNAPAVLATSGDLYLLKRNLPAAKSAFDAALKLDPTFIEGLNGRVAVDLLENRGEAARARVEAELAKTPERTSLLLLAARTYGALRDFPKAEAMMKKAIATDPASPEAYGMLGQFLYQQGRLEEGRLEFEKLSQQQPRSVPARTMLAIIANKQGQVEEAVRQYEQILLIDTDAPVAANNLAWIYVEQNRELDRAIQFATVAVQRLPSDPAVADTLGWAFVRRGLAANGLPHLLTVVQQRPQEPIFRYHLGAAYAQLRNLSKARAELQEALRLSTTFPGAADAQRLLASLKPD